MISDYPRRKHDENDVPSKGATYAGRSSACALAILAQTSGDQKTLTGVVSDTMCGQTHMMKEKPDAECLRYCVKQGIKYALVADKKVYTLEGHGADLDKYAAQKVTVKGTLKGETIKVESVLPAK